MGNDGPSIVSGGPEARGRAGVDPGAPRSDSQIFKISGSLFGKFAFIENEVLGKFISSLLIQLT
mgnify:CR=1 FL=1